MFTYAHVKWFYGQSERAYYLNYFIIYTFAQLVELNYIVINPTHPTPPHPTPPPHPSNLSSHPVSLEIHPLTYLLLI